MIWNGHKTIEIHHLITCAFLNCRRAIVARSRVLFARAGLAGLVGSRGQLVAALPLCADVPTTTAALSSRANDRWGGAGGGGVCLEVITNRVIPLPLGMGRMSTV